jgi:hypothetical protein
MLLLHLSLYDLGFTRVAVMTFGTRFVIMVTVKIHEVALTVHVLAVVNIMRDGVH